MKKLVHGAILGSTLALLSSPSFAGTYGSSNNYVIYGGCEPIRDISVTVDVKKSVIGTTGLGFQLNAYSPPPPAGTPPQDPPASWQQYMMGIGFTGPVPFIQYSIQNWPVNGNSLVFLPSVDLEPLQGDVLPAGYRLQITLHNDRQGRIVAGTFVIIDNAGVPRAEVYKPLSQIQGYSNADLAPVTAYQLNVVGPSGNVLSAGEGTITYAASTPITFENDLPSDKCAFGSPHTATGETLNSVYGAPTVAGKTIVQTFNADVSGQTAGPGPGSGGPQNTGPMCVAPAKWDYHQQKCSSGGGDAYDQAPK